jgi:hypothetical protein
VPCRARGMLLLPCAHSHPAPQRWSWWRHALDVAPGDGQPPSVLAAARLGEWWCVGGSGVLSCCVAASWWVYFCVAWRACAMAAAHHVRSEGVTPVSVRAFGGAELVLSLCFYTTAQ